MPENIKKTPKKRVSTPRLSVSAISVMQGADDPFWICSLPADQIFGCSRVSRADEDNVKGYQRLLGNQRAKRIASYFDSGHIIPGAIVVSAQAQADLRWDLERKSLSFNNIPDAFIVIDGQHRLFGAHFASIPIQLPVAILSKLDLASEVQYFLDINGEQRSVPRTLQIEVTKFLREQEDDEHVRIRIFNELNSRPDSPLCNRLSPTKSVQGKLTHVPFKKAIDGVLQLPAVRKLNFDQKVMLLINFLSATQEILSETAGAEKKLTNAAFFEALFGIFSSVLQQIWERHSNYKIDSFFDVLRPLERISWEMHKGTNRVAIDSLSMHMLDLLTSTDNVSDELF